MLRPVPGLLLATPLSEGPVSKIERSVTEFGYGHRVRNKFYKPSSGDQKGHDVSNNLFLTKVSLCANRVAVTL